MRLSQSPALAQNTITPPYKLGQYHSGFHIWECEKALRAANINVTNLDFITKNNSVRAAQPS